MEQSEIHLSNEFQDKLTVKPSGPLRPNPSIILNATEESIVVIRSPSVQTGGPGGALRQDRNVSIKGGDAIITAEAPGGHILIDGNNSILHMSGSDRKEAITLYMVVLAMTT
jgi:hypothetical protein